MNQKMHVHWDPESDKLELRFGKPTASYYEDIGDDIFERRDEETNKLVGYTFFNFQKRNKQISQDLIIDLPLPNLTKATVS